MILCYSCSITRASEFNSWLISWRFIKIMFAGLTARMYPIPDSTIINLIANGSDVWLYCEVNSTTSRTQTVTWTRVSKGATHSLINDPPHIILRNFISHGNNLTSLLITMNIQETDTGSYRCTSEDENDSILIGVVLVGIVLHSISCFHKRRF